MPIENMNSNEGRVYSDPEGKTLIGNENPGDIAWMSVRGELIKVRYELSMTRNGMDYYEWTPVGDEGD